MREISDKVKLTLTGGLAIRLTNRTGGVSVAGRILMVHALGGNAVDIAAVSGENAIGVFLDAGIPDGQEAWVVVSGIADVLADSTGWTVGDRIVLSNTMAGTGEANNIPSTTVHFTEVGHAVEVAVSTTGRVVLHFN